MRENRPYNPLDKVHLGESVAKAVVSSDIHSLSPDRFEGAGIYAIYYCGSFDPYSPIARVNKDSWEAPIYVGKAVPPGARKGGFGLGATPGTVLYRRLAEHAKSIDQVNNLSLDDFGCRYLVVDDIWIPLGESILVESFTPLWNTVVDGFGNHDPGAGRRNQQRSAWDTLHPGRSWAEQLQPYSTSHEEILKKIEEALSDGEQS